MTFTTMREVTQNLSPITWLTGYAYFRTDLLEMQTHTHSIAAGDSLHNEQMKGAVTIDFSTLPEDIVSFEEAIFSATQNVTHGSPYGFLGTIKMYHLTFTSLANSFSRLPLGYVGVFSDDAALETREIDVTAQLSADYEVRETRNNRSQYRIEFDNSTNNNTSADQAGFTPSSAQITVRYLID